MRYQIWYCYLPLIAILNARTLAESLQDPNTCKSSPDKEECINENSDRGSLSKAVRVVTGEELESKTGGNGSEIWLSLLGEVYDVTAGEEFYGQGKSYGVFAGKDCSLCYVSGVFTADEASKHTDEISDAMLPGVLDWVSFYGTHKSYKFIGYLIDPRFYDDKGEPTSNLVSLRKRISSIQR